MGNHPTNNDLGEDMAAPLMRAAGSRWIVQKFGGTSIGKFPENIVEDVVRPNTKEARIAIVCSARSLTIKSEGTTNRLLRAASEAAKSDSRDFLRIIEDIRSDHHQAAQSKIRHPEILAELQAKIDSECNRLSAFLSATQIVQEISFKSTDVIISVGEKLSCLFMTALLKDRGVPAQYINLYNVVPDGTSGVLDQGFYDMLAREIGKRVRAVEGAVPVVTGFFGSVPGGLLNQIGRGYTDLCAALVAIGVGAEELQVWKEINGIFTADPRKVPTAKLLSSITPAEAAELTFYGSEVINPFTMEQVIRAHVPIRIKNVMNPGGSGTVIFPDSTSEIQFIKPGHDPKLFRARSSSSMSKMARSSASKPRRPTAVTVKKQIIVMNVHSNKRSLLHGFFARIFSILDRYGLSVDLISTSEAHVSMAIHSESAMLANRSATSSARSSPSSPPSHGSDHGRGNMKIVDKDLEGAIQELQEYGTIDISPRMAILSLVGAEMKHMVGVAGRMFTVLGENNVNIEMISQGASEINISCVIEERDADRAMSILHTNMFTHLD